MVTYMVNILLLKVTIDEHSYFVNPMKHGMWWDNNMQYIYIYDVYTL